MEDMTVVFFYVDEKGSGRRRLGKKRFGGWKWSEQWQYNVYQEQRQMGEGSLKIYCVGLPIFEKDKKWTSWSWSQYLKDLPIPPEGRYVYYAPDKKAEKLLGRGREPIGIEWIFTFIEYYSLEFDSLVLIQDREMEAEELIRHYAEGIPYLGVVKDFISDWETVEDSLSMEYGLTLDIQSEFDALHIKGERTLIVLGAGTELPKVKERKGETMVISTAGQRRECDRNLFCWEKLEYVDMERFLKETVLDTVCKIKYNSTR